MSRYIRLAYYLIVVIVTLIALTNLYGDDAEKGTNAGLFLTYALMGLAIAGTVIAALYFMITHPKQGLRSLISIAILAAIVFIGYTAGPGEVLEKYPGFGISTESGSKWVDSGLISVYVLAGGAIIGALYSEVSGFFK